MQKLLSWFKTEPARVFWITWMSYAALYLTRKNISVIKPALHESAGFSVGELGTIDTSFLILYAIGQFFSGFLGDKFGAKRIITIGLFGSAVASFALGFVHSALLFTILFGVNGMFQSTGWSNTIKALEPWFSQEQRGKILGLWGTNQQVGGLLATVMATFLLAHFGVASAFVLPALMVFVAGIVVYLYLIDKSESDVQELAAPRLQTNVTAYKKLLGDPLLWSLSASYFGLKLIRYSLLFWVPFFLHYSLNLDVATAGYLSTAFDVGGIVGSIVVGWISDRYFSHDRIKLISGLILVLAGVLYAYNSSANASIVLNCIFLALIGFFVFGPDALISGACAQDFGGAQMTGSVAGFINGIGSMGAILQGAVTAYVSARWGWNTLFYVFFIIALWASLSLMFFSRRERAKYAKAIRT